MDGNTVCSLLVHKYPMYPIWARDWTIWVRGLSSMSMRHCSLRFLPGFSTSVVRQLTQLETEQIQGLQNICFYYFAQKDKENMAVYQQHLCGSLLSHTHTHTAHQQRQSEKETKQLVKITYQTISNRYAMLIGHPPHSCCRFLLNPCSHLPHLVTSENFRPIKRKKRLWKAKVILENLT